MNESAKIIQASWRGYRTRRAMAKPSSPGVDYDAFIVTNETPMAFPIDRLKSDGEFAFIGCSTFQNIALLFDMIDWSRYQPSLDGYTNIPKLFIVDNSRKVIEFWHLLRGVLLKNKTLNNCLVDIAFMEEAFAKCSPNKNHCVSDLVSTQLEGYITNHTDYEFLRHVLSKATFLQGSFLDKKVFHYIKDCIQRTPAYVYASNILEYVNKPYLKSTFHHRYEHQMQQFLDNLYCLNLACSIHTRTSLDYMATIKPVLKPEITIYSFDESKATLKEKLTNPELAPILGNALTPLLEQYREKIKNGFTFFDNEWLDSQELCTPRSISEPLLFLGNEGNDSDEVLRFKKRDITPSSPKKKKRLE